MTEVRFLYRLARLREKLTETQGEGENASLPVDALLVTFLENARYLTGFTGSNATLIITPDEALFLTDSRYALQSATEVPGWERIVLTPGSLLPEAIAEALKPLKSRSGSPLRRLGFEGSRLTYSEYQAIRKAVPEEIELVPKGDLIESVRQIKDADELAAMRRALTLADRGSEIIQKAAAQPGATEKTVAWELEAFLRTNGASSLSFDPIIGSGPNSALIHGRPSDRIIGSSGGPEFLLCDWGCTVDRYCSDITRTFVVGGEPSDEQRELYDLVARVQSACIDAIRPGVLGKEVDALARQLFAEAGREEQFAHSLGHSLGRFIHESPQLGKRGETLLAPGMVLTVEPGLYVEGFGGVRIEDCVLVTDSGCEVLTQSPKNLIRISR